MEIEGRLSPVLESVCVNHLPAPEEEAKIKGEDLPVTVIERRPTWQIVDLPDLWRYRELLYFLTWRDIKVRYKQTVLGAAWAVLQPFATMVVFSLFLGRMAGVATGSIPYSLWVFTGLVLWTFFSNAITAASNSIVGNQNLVTKVYFPRLIIPMSAVSAGLVDFLIAFGMLLAMMSYYGVAPSWEIVFAPVLILLLVLAALGVGTLLSALTVAYRDFRFIVPFMVQLWLFATPSIYLPAEDIAGELGKKLLPVNPLFGLIQNFRQAMLGGDLNWYSFTISGLVSIALFVVGCLYFRRVERSFADII
jgi:lipopolysaccharide transport system permease protein